RSGQRRKGLAETMRTAWLERVWTGLLWGLMTLFVINIGLMIASVATNSFARRWLGTWLPEGWTTNWYAAAWKEFQLGDILWVTVEVVFAVVFLALLIGVPAAYTLARRNFVGKRLLMLLFLLPLMVPPITYGIPMATVLYKVQLAGTIWGVILAASLLVLVRTIALFELTFLTAGSDSQTLVVALYYAVFAAGVRAPQSVDAMAMVYMAVTLVWLLIALRFVNPTQLVSRVKEHPQGAM